MCVCVCHRAGYKLTQSARAPAELQDSLQRAGSSGAAPGPTSKEFSLERAGMFCAVPKKSFFGSSCRGTGKELGWHRAVRISSASPKERQGRGKVSTGEMLLFPQGSPKPVCFLSRALKLLLAGGWVVSGGHMSSPTPVGVSRQPLVAFGCHPGYVLGLGVHLA